MAIDTGTIIVAGIMAVGNFGGLAFMAKRYAGLVDEHTKTIPVMVKTLEDISKGTEKVAVALNELYNSRNSHESRLVAVETTHNLNGCDQPKLPRVRRKVKR